MYVPHTTYSKQTICSCKMASLESSGFERKMFMGRRKLEGRYRSDLLSFGIFCFQDNHGGVSFWRFRLATLADDMKTPYYSIP